MLLAQQRLQMLEMHGGLLEPSSLHADRGGAPRSPPTYLRQPMLFCENEDMLDVGEGSRIVTRAQLLESTDEEYLAGFDRTSCRQQLAARIQQRLNLLR